jgi:flagellar assembly protein FliH
VGKILNAEEGSHIVEGYSFKKLDLSDINEESVNISDVKKEIEKEKQAIEKAPQAKINDEELGLIEQLLKKSDELASSLVKMEEQFKKQSQECEQRVEEVKQSSYKNGYSSGYSDAKKELEDKVNEHISRLIEGVHKLEEIYKEYQTKAEGIEKELVGVAVDIAQEVIAKELNENSKEVALNLTKELISDIKEATKIEIRLNPVDYDYVSKKLEPDEKIKLVPDSAIKAGGVVISSDVGNIEAEIKERFNAIKNNILKVNN